MKFFVLAATLSSLLVASVSAQKHLMLDTRVIESTENAELVLGTVEKDAANPLFRADRPWENSLNNLYPNVLYDGEEQLYKLWYKCVLADVDAIAKMDDPSTVHDVGWYLLYATSKDGRNWTKPDLGLFGFEGSKQNNAVARDTPNVGVFKDTRPDCEPNRRYKMIYDVGMGNMRVRFSPDGVHWSNPVVPEGLGRVGDTHNNAWWDPGLRKYVLITRFYLGQRLVARSESEDFIHWSAPTLALRPRAGEGKHRQMYCMPAFRYAGIYLGYLMMYRATGDRSVECELTWSPDSINWHRVNPGQCLIPRGPKGSHDSMCIYAPSGPPIIRNGMMEIIYGGSHVPHRGWKRHCLPSMARLRIDGFAGYRPIDNTARAQVVTQPMVCQEAAPRITADINDGSVRVRAIDPLEGSVWAFEPLTESVTDAELTFQSVVRRSPDRPTSPTAGLPGSKRNHDRWKWRLSVDHVDGSSIKGRVVQLHFELENAAVYSFSGLQRIPTPSVLPAARRFEDEARVVLRGPADATGLELRYTLDGTDPTSSSELYDGPVVLTEETTVKAAHFPANGRGPIATARFVHDTPLGPATTNDAAFHTVSFDTGTQGWTGLEEPAHRSEGGLSGGCLSVARAGGSGPILICGSEVLDGAFTGDLQSRYRGAGAEVEFAVRSSQKMRALQFEIFGEAVGQWFYENLDRPDEEWSRRKIRLRYDWTDAEARAAGWRQGPTAASWRETIHAAEKMVIVSAPAGQHGEYEIDEFSVRTLEEVH